jgi:hypothetical protein
MDLARLKTIMYSAILTTGTLIVISCAGMKYVSPIPVVTMVPLSSEERTWERYANLFYS